MRLTLRTLLAYLDDTLDPAEAKDIGQKVGESSAARELIERIKKVTRRRSLANPPVFGEESKLDPNTVAEYLSDVLPADAVSEVEQTCLEHDVYLAEVAACHQILTLMLSEPVGIPPTARQRMYRLVKGREAIPYRRPPAFAVETVGDLRPAPVTEPKPARWPWYLTTTLALALGLIAAIWLAWPKHQSPLLPSAGASEVQVAAVVPPPTTPDKLNVPAGHDVVKIDPPKDPVNTDPAKAPAKIDPPKDPVKPEPPKDPPPAKPNIGAVAVSEPSKSKRELGRLVSPAAILLQKNGGRGVWARVANDARVTAATELLAMPGSRADLKLDTGVTVSVWGNVPELVDGPQLESDATLYAPPDGVDVDLALDRGRVVLTNPRTKPAVARLRFATEVWDVVVGEQGEVLIDLLRKYPGNVAFSKQPGGDGPLTELFLGAVKGRADVLRKDLPPLAAIAPALVYWNSRRGDVDGPTKLRGPLPVWEPTDPKRPQVQEARAAQEEFARRMGGGADVVVVLTEMTHDPKAALQALGAFGLAAVDALPDLLDAVDESSRPVLRGAAILALRHWCARKPENDLALHALLRTKKNFTETNADLALELLHDFSPQDVNNPRTYQSLFVYLNHDRLAIRTLAFWHLIKLDPGGEKVAQYDPDADDAVREKSIAAWRKRIPNGKLPPQPKQP